MRPQQVQLIPFIIFITSILKSLEVKNESLHHHILWQWMYATHPLFCQIIKDKQTYHSAQQWTEWNTPVQEDMMGWENLYKCKPQTNVMQAAFPTFIKWGKTAQTLIRN